MITIYTKTIRFFIIIFSIFCSIFSYHLYAEKKAVFIIGTGRCGSSCTAGLLQIMGLPLGNQLREGHPEVNPKGFFEDIPTVNLTATMLQEIGARFISPLFIKWDTHPRKALFTYRIKKCLQTHFSTYPFFGIKNPIIALFLPLYCQAAQELGYTPKIIIIKRDAEETYASWKKNFKSLSREQIVSAVRCYAQAIDFYAPHYDRLVLNFDDIIHNTHDVAQRLIRFLPELRPYDTVKKEITLFIDKELKHHNSATRQPIQEY